MISKKLHQKIRSYVLSLQQFVGRSWYSPLIAFLAAIDSFIIIVPTDGILISSAMLKPKRWFSLAAWLTIGSTAGSLALASFVEVYGIDFIVQAFPGIETGRLWLWSLKFFESYGLLLVFMVAVTPLSQQPTVIFAALADTPLSKLAVAVFSGRFIKYLLMSYLGSHAPSVLGKFWGIKNELKDAGVKLD